ncbi:hypothetical protein KK137_00865 [Croceibacterium sp. LX-88]|jgi:hypothetical protein|uniref:Uncharacterized protein n=1 Tax=Croceibacterium selenioxidans TaxID=2838833 RepID=A0ABS5VZC7_9SPHN|nr:DUF6152 family protein [Croceibacterium selenioxidans]MBT2132872.1 hypothetical protein [Croceibacterium selenioxidans]
MKTRLHLSLVGFALAAVGAGYSIPSLAHHAFAAEFDSSKPLVVEGTVTRARFVNPHSWIYLDVKNRDGSVTNWGFEFGTPSSLKASGLSRADVAFGTKIKLAGFRAKNGGAFGYAGAIALPDGRKIKTGGAPDAPTPAF